HAERARLFAEEILEAAAIQLPGRRRQQLADAELGAAIDIVASFGEEEAESELADLLGFQVLTEAQHVCEIMPADFHGRFTDLERRLAHGMRAPLDHGDRQAGIALAQLDR